MAEAARAFVSHSHADTAWTRPFVEALRQAGADVWYDEHNLGYGVLADEIERELRARPIFLVVLSPAAVASPWVRRETAAAIRLQDQDSTRIILPVMAAKAEVPLLWSAYRRISGPDDAGLAPAEAARHVVHALALVPAEARSAPTPPVVSETAEAAWERGKGLYAQSRYQEALAAYERAVTLEPGNAVYSRDKGNALYTQRRYREARAAYERALELDPKYAIAWNNKIAALEKLRRTSEAKAARKQLALALGSVPSVEDHLRDQARLSPPTPSDAPKRRRSVYIV